MRTSRFLSDQTMIKYAAEDLPGASFAGQQETFLNVIGIEAVLASVQRCFASLWTDRAIEYRARLGLDPRSVRLAVVFTANPLTGNRREVVINANPGLGETVFSCDPFSPEYPSFDEMIYFRHRVCVYSMTIGSAARSVLSFVDSM